MFYNSAEKQTKTNISCIWYQSPHTRIKPFLS